MLHPCRACLVRSLRGPTGSPHSTSPTGTTGRAALHGGKLWYSSDGIDWQAAPVPPGFELVYTLAGHDGDLFALTGDTSDLTTRQTLWHRSSGSQWETVLSHELLQRIAIGADRVIAYQRSPFDVLAVYDATTLEQMEFNGIPTSSAPNKSQDPYR